VANIDVSDLLLDPDFVDAITVIHRTATVDQYGVNQIVETAVPSYGCVQPASGESVQRLADALQSSDISSFWVQGRIIADATSSYPDIIVWQGNRFQVQLVNDYMNYGRGYTQGICTRERITSG
jgi:hypothetical protein